MSHNQKVVLEVPEKLLKHQVAEALGCTLVELRDSEVRYWGCGCPAIEVHGTLAGGVYDYHISWEHTGPWIEKLGIGLNCIMNRFVKPPADPRNWIASLRDIHKNGKTPLEAVCQLIAARVKL